MNHERVCNKKKSQNVNSDLILFCTKGTKKVSLPTLKNLSILVTNLQVSARFFLSQYTNNFLYANGIKVKLYFSQITMGELKV